MFFVNFERKNIFKSCKQTCELMFNQGESIAFNEAEQHSNIRPCFLFSKKEIIRKLPNQS